MGWTSGMDFWSLSRPQIVQGLTMMFMMMPLTQMALSSVEPREVPSAAGLQNFMRTMAIAVVTSVVLNDWGDQQRIKHNGFADVLHPDAVSQTLSGTGMGGDTVLTIINNLVDEQAVTLAMDHTFLLAAIGGLISLALVWLVPRPKVALGVSGGH
jgi:DHA2 family multidrug resistance protein